MGPTNYVPGNNHCPKCGMLLDAATGVDHNDSPSPGDFTVCFGCGIILKFDEDLRLRRLTVDELVELTESPVWPVIDRAQELVRYARRTAAKKVWAN